MTPEAERTLRLVQGLLKVSTDRGLRLHAVRMSERLKLPMSAVLAKVPGDTVSDKCDKIGISRQAYYAWLQGISRPSRKHAMKLANITGYDAREIRGRPLVSSPRAAATVGAPSAPRRA
jgi:transcriptional regulator with XRE-family HTH domain